jgi:PAS domain S-box-containing protein
VYTAFLVSALAALITVLSIADPSLRDPLGLVALTALLVFVERTDLQFYDDREVWGLSAAEAVLLPMIVALALPLVAACAAAAMLIARLESWRRAPNKELFNVAQYGLSAAAASGVWMIVNDGSAEFTVRNAGAAALGVVSFAILSHVFVAAGFHLARRGIFRDALRDVAPAALLNLGGSIVVGLFFAAAYAAARWTVVLFPIPLIALYFALRAVLRQRSESQRLEKLHEASRALAANPDLGDALAEFLPSVAEIASAQGAFAIVSMRDGFRYSGVHGQEQRARLELVDQTPINDLLARIHQDPRPVVVGENDGDGAGPLKTHLGVHSLIAVPVMDAGRLVGVLMVVDRTGAGVFGETDVRLLEALSNELVLSLGSHRLFNEVVEERERFQLLVEAVHDYAIYMTDPEGYVVSWNAGAERITGYGADEIVGQHFSRFYPTDMQTWRDELEGALVEQRSEVEGWRIRKDGTRFFANEIVTPIRDASGLRGFAKVTRDITEARKAQEERDSLQSQLHQSQKLETVGQLAGGIAHDFNNLMSVILNCASFVADELDENSEMREDMDEIRAAADRAVALTRQLLVFSRREAADPEPMDINEVIGGMEKLLRRAVQENVAVVLDLEDDLPSVLGNPGQLEQVLMNLAINARDAMSGRGTLSISTSNVDLDETEAKRHLDFRPGRYVRLTVSDTGAGMTPDVIAKAFEPFFTTKPKGQGTGLGLATVYGIVKQTGGDIVIKSDPGVGATFDIHLPVCDETVSVEVTPIRRDVRVRHGESALLVEDEDGVRSVARRILESEGFTVVEATSAEHALQVAASLHRIDLLVSDVAMPGMSGIGLAEQLKPTRPEMSVVLMSGYSEALNDASPPKVADAVIHKPFDRQGLMDVIDEVLEATHVKSEQVITIEGSAT